MGKVNEATRNTLFYLSFLLFNLPCVINYVFFSSFLYDPHFLLIPTECQFISMVSQVAHRLLAVKAEDSMG